MRETLSHPPTWGSGDIFTLVATGRATTRSDLGTLTQLSRPTIQARLEPLLEAGLLREGELVGSGGRPARRLEVDQNAAVVIGVDVGEDHTRVALHDLRGAVIDSRVLDVQPRIGPEAHLGQVVPAAEELLAAHGTDVEHALGIGIALPAPVDDARGCTVGWSVLAGWEGFDIAAFLDTHLSLPAVVDNDVNLLTLAEHRRYWPDVSHLFYVKVGNGIGSGIVVNGQVDRGAQGASGDLGHSHLTDAEQRLCRCGNVGCLEALAGGWALARHLSASRTEPVQHVRDLVALVESGDAEATLAVRESGRHVGEMVALATSLLNPAVIVIGGALSAVGGHLVAGVRQVVYQRAHPLATRQLRIVQARQDPLAGVVGAALVVIDTALAPRHINDAILTPGWRHSWTWLPNGE